LKVCYIGLEVFPFNISRNSSISSELAMNHCHPFAMMLEAEGMGAPIVSFLPAV
jgi:hypothetical protein